MLYYADGTTPVVAGTPLTPAEAASLVFTPTANFNGTVTIPFTVTDDDGATSAPANEVITVNDVNDPPVDDNEVEVIDEDVTHVVADGDPGDLLQNASDPEGDALTITDYAIAGVSGVQTPGAAVSIPGVGAIRINADGSYEFAPANNFNGSVPLITYTVADGNGGTDTSTLQLTFSPVNDAPAGADDTITIDEDTSYTFDAADFGFTDPDGDAFENIIIKTAERRHADVQQHSGASTQLTIPASDIGLLCLRQQTMPTARLIRHSNSRSSMTAALPMAAKIPTRARTRSPSTSPPSTMHRSPKTMARSRLQVAPRIPSTLLAAGAARWLTIRRPTRCP